VLIDAGQAGGLEFRAVSIHRQRPGAVGVVTAGDNRVVAAVAQGPAAGGPLHKHCRDAVRYFLGRVQEYLLRRPEEPVEKLIESPIEEPEIGLLLAVVDDRRGFSVARSGGGTAYRLVGGRFERMAGGSGSLAPGEALVLATDGLNPGPALGERWGSGAPPGPIEFLDSLYRPRDAGDRGVVAVWATPDGRP
jgi:hypothetical protein